MAESNKILTVSYGTFSCTLEGFDDAFTTMKAIAEYFRDLAADDRFFGAEPPTPDPELLARLASRAAARRVEARQDDTGIVLRQDSAALDQADMAEDVAEVGAAEKAVTPPAQAEAQPVAEDAHEDTAQDVIEDPAAEAPEEITEEITEAVADEAPTAKDAPKAEAPAPSAPKARAVTAQAIVPAKTAAPRPAPRKLATRKHVHVSTGPTRRARIEAAQAPVADAPEAPKSATPLRPVSEMTSVAAKLQRIRDVVSKNRPADTEFTPSDFSEDEHAEEQLDSRDAALLGNLSDVDNTPVAADPMPEMMLDDSAASDDGDHEDYDDVAEDADAPFAMADEDLDDAPDAQTEAEIDDAIAAIGETLAEDEAEDDVEGDAWMQADEVEDEDADEDFDLTAALAYAETPADDAAEDAEVAHDEAYDEAHDGDAFEAELDTSYDASFDDSIPAEAPVQQAEPEAAPARPVARVLKVKRRDFDAAVQDGTLQEEEDTPVRTYGDSTLSPEDEAELQSELKALEDEIAGADMVEDSLDDEDAQDEDFDTTSWDGADDADDADAYDDALVADDQDEDDVEDAQRAADIAQWEEDEAAQAAVEDAAPAQDDQPRISPRRRLMDRADGDMDRILAETNNQLGDSDGTRRRSAIAHLRAAVAATKAEKQAGVEPEDDSQEKADAYRDDLAQVVRPRRPALRGDTPARRAEDRPAPLKLVAEQRVDRDASAGPVRPRRIRVADLAQREEEAEQRQIRDEDMDHGAEAHARAAAANAASFTEFADRVGAFELPEILEAAASYLAFIEGRDEFTRPQLMGKARQALADEFSREDGLRHFGRLLREGKLRKVAAGQFTVSDRINFRPEERIAG
ncbi:hypothetical protein [Pseudooceanicola nitratireducens]|uniref:hypothetical protein n=1 Tax=Pseudooceanicola nitratireducens TaxID=517719 RepID=UPI001C97156B|nr:hypothetical protein [Pseudooceanicola nitratireducens]MBY6156483.1 hypothetical protein [Pseudooceanicola nitratireducens]